MDSYLNKAKNASDKIDYWTAQGNAEHAEHTATNAQAAIAYALIAIAESLDEMNQIEHNRLERQLRRRR